MRLGCCVFSFRPGGPLQVGDLQVSRAFPRIISRAVEEPGLGLQGSGDNGCWTGGGMKAPAVANSTPPARRGNSALKVGWTGALSSTRRRQGHGIGHLSFAGNGGLVIKILAVSHKQPDNYALHLQEGQQRPVSKNLEGLRSLASVELPLSGAACLGLSGPRKSS